MSAELWGVRALAALMTLAVSAPGAYLLADDFFAESMLRRTRCTKAGSLKGPRWLARLLLTDAAPERAGRKRLWMHRIAMTAGVLFAVSELLLGWLPFAMPVRAFCGISCCIGAVCTAWGLSRTLREKYGTPWILLRWDDGKPDSILYAAALAGILLAFGYGYAFNFG